MKNILVWFFTHPIGFGGDKNFVYMPPFLWLILLGAIVWVTIRRLKAKL